MPLNLSQPKRKNAISLTPLIDVVFILLLFFMLTSSFVPWRIVDTPLSVASDVLVTPQEKDNVVLTLKLNDDQVWMNDQPIRFADQTRFQTLIADHSEGIFIIKAEEGVTLQTLMHLADRLKLNGAKTVSIANAFAMPGAK
ncbi:biopolymer transporter ExbD [Marinomonas primoryensis]|uniref:Biopolymer transporter ExbD n=1 Tax=Marinomonas primoryensis TaxID=178399 RepID=A0A2Z4PMV5_9GAMM|nr:biopolymer transporter ExbD [Marinomonas primoryensis]AWX98776.1 biopolymer transporter ExbD [Marinomonas primoryensis]